MVLGGGETAASAARFIEAPEPSNSLSHIEDGAAPVGAKRQAGGDPRTVLDSERDQAACCRSAAAQAAAPQLMQDSPRRHAPEANGGRFSPDEIPITKSSSLLGLAAHRYDS